MRLKYKKMIFFITMWIMGIGMLTISFRKPEKEESSVSASSSSIEKNINSTPTLEVATATTNTPTPIPTATPIPEDPTKLKKCEDPKINQLVETFYQAMLNTDEETIRSIVTDTSVIDIDKISKKHEYIEAYDNFVCYTKPGVNDGDFVVYLTYDMKITTIETYSSSLDRCYVIKKGDTYLIQYNNFDHITDNLMKTYDQDTDVQDLLKQVNDNVKKAREADSDLDDFINNLTSSLKDSNSSTKDNEASESSTSKDTNKQDD